MLSVPPLVKLPTTSVLPPTWFAAMDTSYVDGEILAYDARIFEILSYEPLAECYYKLGKHKESNAYYSLVEQCDPTNMEIKIKRQFTAAKAKKK